MDSMSETLALTALVSSLGSWLDLLVRNNLLLSLAGSLGGLQIASFRSGEAMPFVLAGADLGLLISWLVPPAVPIETDLAIKRLAPEGRGLGDLFEKLASYALKIILLGEALGGFAFGCAGIVIEGSFTKWWASLGAWLGVVFMTLFCLKISKGCGRVMRDTLLTCMKKT